jgi:hypothetical protein
LLVYHLVEHGGQVLAKAAIRRFTRRGILDFVVQDSCTPPGFRKIANLEPLLSANPANKGDRGWMAEGYLILGRAEWRLGQPEPACAAFGRGARIAAELPTAGADQWLAGIQRALVDGVSGCGR